MSYTPPNSTPYKSSAWSDTAAAGQPRMRFSLPQESAIQLAAYGFDQTFQMSVSAFGNSGPSPKNTTAAGFSSDLSDANAILTGYSQPSHMGGTLMVFDASFQRVPASWDDFKVIPFTFPGFLNTASAQPRRDPVTYNVPCRIHYDYYVLDPANIISTCTDGTPASASAIYDSGGSTHPTCVYKLGDIPIVAKSKFYAIASTDTTQVTNSLVPSGGITAGSITYLATMPYPSNYQTWMANAISNKWSSTVWDGSTNSGSTYGQLVAEDSRIEPFAGNIVQRVTMYVLAR